MNRNCNTYKD